MNGLRVWARLQETRNVHARVMVLAYDLVLKREHQIHRLRDGVGEGAPPALDLRTLGQFDEGETLLVSRLVLATKGIYCRPLDRALLGLVATECRLGDAHPGTGFFKGQALVLAQSAQVCAQLAPAGGGSNC